MAPAAHLLQELRPGRTLAERNAGRDAFFTDQLGHFQSGHAAVGTQALFLGVERESELRLLDGGNPHVAERPVAGLGFVSPFCVPRIAAKPRPSQWNSCTQERGYTSGYAKRRIPGNLGTMAKPPAKAPKESRSPVKKKAGRPRAKHSDPDYKQMSVYVHKDVRNKAKARLFEQGGEFSALVESLLRDWLKKPQ